MKKLQLFLICFMTFFICFPENAYASAEKGRTEVAKATPEAWLTKKGREFLDILSVSEVKARYVKLRRFCKEVFNQEEMPRLAMAGHWKKLSPEQQGEIKRLFFDYFVVTYGSIGFDFSGVSLQVTETVPSGKDLLLKTQVNINRKAENRSVRNKKNDNPFVLSESNDKGGAIEILFALRKNGSGYYIRDAKFEGQSVLMFLRSHLEKEYQAVDFDADKLLAGIKEKINKRYRAAEELAKAEDEKRNGNFAASAL